MKRILILGFMAVATLFTVQSVSAQAKQKKTIESNAITKANPAVTALQKPVNDKNKPATQSRGDVYGSDYSDIIVNNYTGYYVDVYVDNSYRVTLAPYTRKVTWAVPGKTVLYAKAPFTDGTYLYWGPQTATTGYEYTWNLRK